MCGVLVDFLFLCDELWGNREQKRAKEGAISCNINWMTAVSFCHSNSWGFGSRLLAPTPGGCKAHEEDARDRTRQADWPLSA
jgi:hypothetical protein